MELWLEEGLAWSEEFWLADEPAFLLFTDFFFVAGMALSFAGVRSTGLMPQKDAPKFLMTLGEIVGGLAAQPSQFLSLQEVGEDLNPLLISFSLMLLLTSASESGALPFLLGVFLGVVTLSGALELLTSVSRPRSSPSDSRTAKEVCSKLEQI